MGTRSEQKALRVSRGDGHGVGGFDAMASPCWVLAEGQRESRTRELTRLVAREVWRIEAKFSRYRPDSALSRLNAAAGGPAHEVDNETADLLDFAAHCHQLSDGAFDITSGVLREVWRFDGSDRIPAPEAVAALLPRIGWHLVEWRRPALRLPAGMQLDFGGFGKEYAADKAAGLLRAAAPEVSCLVNLGGDLVVTRPRRDGRPWRVGIESPQGPGTEGLLELRQGALCTSGDARRYLLRDGVRYGHILDPHTGWPAPGAPRSVTVAAPTCTEAGLLATLAMLAGEGATAFLRAQQVAHWVVR